MATQVTLNSGAVSSAGSLKLQTNGTTDAVTIDTAQNVGLGVTPSAFTFPFTSGTLQMAGGFSMAPWSSNAQMYISTNAYYNAGWKYNASSKQAAQYFLGDGGHAWYTAPSGTAGNPITFTQAMTLDANGRLGIGTSSPGFPLDVVGTGGRFTSATGIQTVIEYAPGLAYIGTTSNHPLLFETNSTERARIDTSGNLLVGTTSVPNGTSIPGLCLRSPNAGRNISAATSTTQVIHWGFYNGNGEVGGIYTSGSTTTFYTSSDYRLKEITGELTGYKERLFALQPKQGSWKVDGSEFRGFLAHEFAQSYPASVNGEKDAVDKDGNPKYQGMQAGSSEVIADLVAYIKELETRLTALEAK